MKKTLAFLIFIGILFSCVPAPGSNCGSGNNLCFEFQGNTIAFDSAYYNWNSSTYYRIKGITNVGADNYNITFLLAGDDDPSVESYTLDINSFKIIKNGVGTTYYGSSGTINITSLQDNYIYGEFSGNVKLNNYGADIPITNGHIDGIHWP